MSLPPPPHRRTYLSAPERLEYDDSLESGLEDIPRTPGMDVPTGGVVKDERGQKASLYSTVLGAVGITTLFTGFFGFWLLFVPFIFSGLAIWQARVAKKYGTSAPWGMVLGIVGIAIAVLLVLLTLLIIGLGFAVFSAFS